MAEEIQPNSLSLAFVEELYEQYRSDPGSVSEDWRRYFDGLGSAGSAASPGILKARPAGRARQSGNGARARKSQLVPERIPANCVEYGLEMEVAALQHRVDMFVRNYRVRGHRISQIDPLGMATDLPLELDPAYHNFSEADMDIEFPPETLMGVGKVTLREIIERLQNTYCRSIGVQYMHIDELAVRAWLQERMESTENRITLGREEQLRILTRLTDAVIFEEFIQTKYIGAKRFSLEGAESLIPLLEQAIERAGEHGIREVVLGMAHRGRLNVLANIMGKSPRAIFREFADIDAQNNLGRGDVKYHLGFHSDWETASGQMVHVALCFNPSHLEYVNPVALGRVRAKEDRLGDTQREQHLAILIHGDASFAGEGVVQETLNLSELEGYRTGGTLHIIVNNQLGFTTMPDEGRSSTYATDVARMLQIPIFHVNGENPEAVTQAIFLAMEFRKIFKRDVVIDMYCYRRRGHNEGDEPSFTQPIMYRKIEERPSVRESYLTHLLGLGEISREEADEIAERRKENLEQELSELREEDTRPRPSILGRVWKHYVGGRDIDVADPDTGVARKRLGYLLEAQTRLPKDFTVHPKLERFIEARAAMAKGEQPIDWSNAEALAFATVATEGYRVRLSGQDSQRGTFSHRHSVFHDYQSEVHLTYTPLQHVEAGQAVVEIFNSPLSEAGVLGFEYGFSIGYPDALVLWEAQFGDFVNAAQVIIDQFIASAEDKWRGLSGLVMLLPHGFEGMGPEHSSARIERFLTLAAEDNMQVCYPSTPAQYFHLLRRQVIRPWRKPLVVMTPKSLLRNKECVSALDDFATGKFQRIITDSMPLDRKLSRVLLCAGKIYYELDKHRQDSGRDDVAILRIEQLYPLQVEMLYEMLESVKDGTPVVWVQEEPENMGAWRHMLITFGTKVDGRLPFSGAYRIASASPATGSANSHKLEQQQLINMAFDGGNSVR